MRASKIRAAGLFLLLLFVIFYDGLERYRAKKLMQQVYEEAQVQAMSEMKAKVWEVVRNMEEHRASKEAVGRQTQ